MARYLNDASPCSCSNQPLEIVVHSATNDKHTTPNICHRKYQGPSKGIQKRSPNIRFMQGKGFMVQRHLPSPESFFPRLHVSSYFLLLPQTAVLITSSYLVLPEFVDSLSNRIWTHQLAKEPLSYPLRFLWTRPFLQRTAFYHTLTVLRVIIPHLLLSPLSPSMSTTSTSGVFSRPKTLIYADCSSFVDVIREMGVQQTSRPLPDPGQTRLVFEALEEPSLYENEDSLSHAMQTRSNAPNETSFYLVFEFLLTGWLCKLSTLRYVFNGQWRVEPLDGSPHAFQLAAPKPDITIGYNETFLTGGSRICRPVVDSAPVICDHRLEYPCVTIEVDINETSFWFNQNLHNAAVMLRILRSLWIKVHDSAFGFDNTVRTVTISVSRNLVEVLGHWSGVDDYGDVLYHHSPLSTWFLGAGEADWQRARWGLKCYVEWIMRENQEWIINALRQKKCSNTQHY